MLIYIYKNNQQTGPFEEAKVLEWLASGQLSPEDLAVKQGDSQWKPLKVLFPSAPQTSFNPHFGTAPVNAPAVGAANIQPAKSGSNGIVYLLVAVGGFLLLAVIGVAGYFFLAKSSRTAVKPNLNINSSNSNSTNSNSNSNSTSTTLSFKELKDKAKELSKLTPTLKPESKPSLKGKIVIVENTIADSEYSSAELKGIKSYNDTYDESELTSYGLTKENLATKPEEIDTVVQINCSKGSRIGTYVTSEGSVPAYSKTCKVSVINYRDSKIIAQKTFVNRKMEQTVTLSRGDTEYVLLHPYKEVQAYIKSLPKA